MKERERKNICFLKEKGFTLAEILIAVAIIGILVAVSIPFFSGRIEKARIATTEANIRYAEAAALADWMGTAKMENVSENIFLTKLKSFMSPVVVYAGGNLYAEDSSYVVYLYDAENNSLVPNSDLSPVITAKKNNLYTRIAVRITKENGSVDTFPYILENGGENSLVAGFGTNSFDIAANQGAEAAASAENAETNQSSGGETPSGGTTVQPSFPGVIATHSGGGNN